MSEGIHSYVVDKDTDLNVFGSRMVDNATLCDSKWYYIGIEGAETHDASGVTDHDRTGVG